MADTARARAWVVIPARGGSRGIANKNLQCIQGRSLVARAVQAARGAKSIDRIFVSTDSDAIAAEARGAEIVRRPAALASDTSSTESALLHALDELQKRNLDLPELLVLVQCTSPFVSSLDIDGTVGALLSAGADTAHSVVRSHGFLWRRAPSGAAEGVNHDKSVRKRRQDMEPEFLETGGVYAMRLAGFRKAQHRFFGRTVLHEVAARSALEIDSPDEFALARLIARSVDLTLQADSVPFMPAAIVFDFDGVFTDNRVVHAQNGVESVICSRADGYGIEMLRRAGVPMLVLSREANPVVVSRCEKLGLPCWHGLETKAGHLRRFAFEKGISLDRVAYVGNDVNDLECLEIVGLPIAVADAHPSVLTKSAFILSHGGGQGAIRELADILLPAARKSMGDPASA